MSLKFPISLVGKRAAGDASTPPLPLLWWNLDDDGVWANQGTEAGAGWDLSEGGTVATTTATIGSTSRTFAVMGLTAYLEYDNAGTKTVAHPSTSEDLSLSAWVKYTSVGTTFGEIINHRDGLADRNYQMMIWNDNKNADYWQFQDDDIGILEVETDVADALTASTWYHLCTTFDSSTGTGKFYINGTLEKTVTDATVDTIGTAAAPFALGTAAWAKNNQSALGFNGSMCRVGVFDEVLTEAQITTLAEGDARPYSEIWT